MFYVRSTVPFQIGRYAPQNPPPQPYWWYPVSGEDWYDTLRNIKAAGGSCWAYCNPEDHPEGFVNLPGLLAQIEQDPPSDPLAGLE